MSPQSSISTPQSPGSAGLGRRERKAIATRRALLDAGLRAFEATPLALIAVQNITDGADVAKGVFYLHFHSRDDFLLALLRDVHERFIERARNATRGHRSLRSRLEALIHTYAAMPGQHMCEVIFRMRMSSYMSDEIGAPGDMAALRTAYVGQLANVAVGRCDANAIEIISTIDACCWGIIWHRLSLNLRPLSPGDLAQRVLPTLRSLTQRPVRSRV